MFKSEISLGHDLSFFGIGPWASYIIIIQANIISQLLMTPYERSLLSFQKKYNNYYCIVDPIY